MKILLLLKFLSRFFHLVAFIWEFKGLFTWKEDDPSAGIILARELKDSSRLQAKFSGRVRARLHGKRMILALGSS